MADETTERLTRGDLDLDAPLPEAGDLGGETPAGPPPSPNALDVDRWAQRRGRQLLSNTPALFKKLVDDMAPVARMTPADLVDRAEAQCADFFDAAFNPMPELVENCEEKRRSEFLAGLMQTDDYRELHRLTNLDGNASEIAAMAFAGSYATLVQEDAKAQAEGGNPGGKPGGLGDEIRGLKHAAKAAKEACKDVGEYRDAADMAGLGPGDPGGKMNAKRAADLFKRVRNSTRLRKIAEQAGRFRRAAATAQRKKLSHGRDDVVGVDLGGRVADLVPVELMHLCHPGLRLDAMRRLAENGAVVREWRGIEKVGRGPVVVVVDESGSMGQVMGKAGATRLEAAKGMALALAWIARRQKRYCALVAFSGGTQGRVCVLRPGEPNEGPLMDWLEANLGGGTTCDVPLVELPFKMWPQIGAPAGKTDIVMITDAEVDVPDQVVKDFNVWRKAQQARVCTVVIGEQPGDLARVSDETHPVATLTADSDESQAVLSV